ncbi:hypothetical protein AVEN_126215-1 [Araneus ventricosus]|uniref:Uncharacterized protein n=1 Tax=Araneus ventricosus TaxID=182803 RepID=A0A4Y2PP29_ARAVE|nr:hypothetical protein AVEN_126215-1 [Araneus ventricosus]
MSHVHSTGTGAVMASGTGTWDGVLLNKNKEYLEDAQFVQDFLNSTVEKRKRVEENRKQEEKIRGEKIRHRIEQEHELELVRSRATRNDENRSPLYSVTSNGDDGVSLDKLTKGVELLTIPVPRKTKSWSLFFDSLERAYNHQKVTEEFHAEILKFLDIKRQMSLFILKKKI